MRANRRKQRDEVKKRSRTTKEQADEQGMGETGEGVRLPVPSYTEDDHASFPGVDEPVVDPEDQGSSPPATTLPS
jgi:hypothetical protein